MRPSARPARMVALGAVVALLIGLAVARPAAAGEYAINACQADRQSFSSEAFADFATRGMKWKRACNPVGAGLRGLVTGNVVRAGRVERGAQARFVLEAPAGTRFVRFRWSGKIRRRDCRYALQLYADRPDGPPFPIKNVRAGSGCPRRGRAQSSGLPRPRSFDIAGATRIIQRAVCVGGGSGERYCSARSINHIRTFQAQATVIDVSGPAVGVVTDNPFTQGAWVNGDQSVTYSASDNVGIKLAQAIASGVAAGNHARPCDYTRTIPCSNDPGRIAVDTARMAEGTQTLQVVAVDAADNWNTSEPVTVRVDRTAPGAVALAVEGGDGWRQANDFAVTWQNPDEGDRAPITGAHWKLCRTGTGHCTSGSQAGPGLASLAGLRVPEPGDWELRLVREDAAGNRNDAYASEPVRLRHDPEPPTLAFEPILAADPTSVSVAVADKVSGVAGGQVEISAEGSNSWQALPTQLEAGRLVTRIDDAVLAPGRYLLRGQASDLAGNIGQAAAGPITLPLRIQSALRAGVAKTRVVRERVRRRQGTRRRWVRREVIVLSPSARVRYGGHATISGQLTNRDGQPLPGQQIQVIGPGPNGDQLLATLTTDAEGRYSYRAAGTTSRVLRFVFAGSPTVLPAESRVTLRVPAAGSFATSRRRLLNGGRVVFRGRVRSLPLPAAGKLVEIQVRQPSGEWTTFRTLRSDADGRWALRYRFKNTSCHTRYRLRARIPVEAGYPFAPGHTRARSVLVRGAQGPCP